MWYSSETVKNILVISVHLKRATMAETDKFKQYIADQLGEDKKHLIIDLSECEFIDSSFLGLIVAQLKRMTAAGHELKLVGFQPAVQSMFELTRMYKIIEAYSTVDEALASFEETE